jgi:hypothetical protein
MFSVAYLSDSFLIILSLTLFLGHIIKELNISVFKTIKRLFLDHSGSKFCVILILKFLCFMSHIRFIWNSALVDNWVFQAQCTNVNLDLDPFLHTSTVLLLFETCYDTARSMIDSATTAPKFLNEGIHDSKNRSQNANKQRRRKL